MNRPRAEAEVAILALIYAYAPRKVASATPASRLWDDLGYDSIDIIEMCMAVEEAIDIVIEPDVELDWKTAADVIDAALGRVVV